MNFVDGQCESHSAHTHHGPSVAQRVGRSPVFRVSRQDWLESNFVNQFVMTSTCHLADETLEPHNRFVCKRFFSGTQNGLMHGQLRFK